MLSWSLKLFRIRGIQLAVHSSFFLLLAYLAYEGWNDDGWTGLWWSVATLLAFFTCVVLHELGHSFTAQHYGVGVSRILLMPIGGMAQFDQIPRRPRHELLITLAGPAVNFAIAAGLWVFLSFPEDWMDGMETYSVSGFFHLLFFWNLLMGCFNLLPAFPMDGGRILRATLASRMNYLRATWWAASIGKVVCVLGIGVGLWREHYMWVLLFGFIFGAGEMELRAVRRREQEDADWHRLRANLEVPPSLPPTGEPPLLTR